MLSLPKNARKLAYRMSKLDKKQFLKKYDIPVKRFQRARVNWDDLVAIYEHYLGIRNQLEPIAALFVESLRHIPEVHSLKARTKDPEHLLEKVIRKRIADRRRKIDATNYREQITDLIGVRVLHLFKDDWLPIHKAITSMFALRGHPIANIRKGDSNPMIDVFNKNKWPVIEHEFGYRSIHYLAVSQPGKDEFTVEIQVRTIFEEGWSEIDHHTRYPYDFNNVLLTQYLVLFNRLAGSADEMGSFVKTLKDQLNRRQRTHSAALAEKDELIAQLKKKVQRSQIQTAEKRSLVAGLDSLSSKDISHSVAALRGAMTGDVGVDVFAPLSGTQTRPISIDIDQSRLTYEPSQIWGGEYRLTTATPSSKGAATAKRRHEPKPRSKITRRRKSHKR